ncbi:MAG: hypothetical protein CMH76_02640 [Nitrospinae bacterium]|nr:hypothetical protein [Nitrospinota bacterium]
MRAYGHPWARTIGKKYSGLFCSVGSVILAFFFAAVKAENGYGEGRPRRFPGPRRGAQAEPRTWTSRERIP